MDVVGGGIGDSMGLGVSFACGGRWVGLVVAFGGCASRPQGAVCLGEDSGERFWVEGWERGWVGRDGEAGDGGAVGMVDAQGLEGGQLEDVDVAVMRSNDLG